MSEAGRGLTSWGRVGMVLGWRLEGEKRRAMLRLRIDLDSVREMAMHFEQHEGLPAWVWTIVSGLMG